MDKKTKFKVISELKDFLQLKRKLSFEDPSINPISSHAHDISRKLVSGELDFDVIRTIIESLSEELTLTRISNLSNTKKFSVKSLVNKIIERNKLRRIDRRWNRDRNGASYFGKPIKRQ